mmetsp:Transcript_16257/g.36126  ORF Transcript_16257/g.36126 Transcript_16257/m.36126 type:complete len:268 (-) Transcript_16257:237-1040(-)
MKTSSTRTSAKSMKQSSVIIKRANKTATPKRTAKTEPKRRRTLSGYNYFMKYHRAITVTGDEPSRVLIDPNLTRDKKRHYVDKIIANEPYRLNGGKKRPHRKSHGVIGFKELTLAVARTWKSLDVSTKSIFEDMSREGKDRTERKNTITVRTTVKKGRSSSPSSVAAAPVSSSSDDRSCNNGVNIPSIRTPQGPITSEVLPPKVESQLWFSSPVSTVSGSSTPIDEVMFLPEEESSLFPPAPIDANIAPVSNQELSSFLSTLDWEML